MPGLVLLILIVAVTAQSCNPYDDNCIEPVGCEPCFENEVCMSYPDAIEKTIAGFIAGLILLTLLLWAISDIISSTNIDPLLWNIIHHL